MTDHRLDGFYDVVAARRDVRNGFTRAPVDDAALTRVLAAAHAAGSVGHSQPWDFLIVRDIERRRQVQALAQRQRERFAASLPSARAESFRDLKTEAILDTPVNVVVTCDPTRGGASQRSRSSRPPAGPASDRWPGPCTPSTTGSAGCQGRPA